MQVSKNPRGPSLKNEKSRERKFENLKDAGLKKSERSEFENEIFGKGEMLKNERSEGEKFEKSEGQNEIER